MKIGPMLILTQVLTWIFASFGYFLLAHDVFENTSHELQKVDTDVNSTSINESVTNHSTQAKWQHLCPYMQYKCSELPGYCLTCNFNTSCIYGMVTNVTCFPRHGVYCKDPDIENKSNHVLTTDSPQSSYYPKDYTDCLIQKSIICRYCHQLDDSEIVCIGRTNCRQPNVARSFYETRCEPLPHVLCLGRRVFRRMVPCDWSSGKSYALTVILSLFFGGLGVDRFYLGMWIEGLGKLFSFGGLGLWSIVDFILIVSGYIKPPGDAVYW
uniref:TM2 domain-containing protein n=1 Tax=Trichobilharzia regenti TaxID=157069 RepID=A0AA85JBJ5_TRIRE|nr:unnamed protein product [Trichobilharzia regenti]